jgi:hypothetical protein
VRFTTQSFPPFYPARISFVTFAVKKRGFVSSLSHRKAVPYHQETIKILFLKTFVRFQSYSIHPACMSFVTFAVEIFHRSQVFSEMMRGFE